MTERPKRLYRSQTDRVIAGICGGIGEYFGVDPTLVRVLWVLLSLLPLVPGILIYVVAYFVIPVNPQQTAVNSERSSTTATGKQFVGAILILVGALWLLNNLDFISIGWWWRQSWRYSFPALLILGGLAVMLKKSSNGAQYVGEKESTQTASPHDQSSSQENQSDAAQGKKKVLRRSLKDKKILGVCGGLGEYLDIDSNIIRIGFALVAIGTVGVGLFLYLFIYFLMERESSTG